MFKYLKIAFINLTLLMFILSIDLNAEQINPTKQEIWDNMSADVDHWIDGARYRIDKEIKEIVVALNVMGIETTASCGGHLDRDLTYPWVDIQIYPPETQKLMQELLSIQEQESNEEISLKIKFPNFGYQDFYDTPEAENLRNLGQKHRIITDSISQIQIKCLEPLNQLLNQFYENRTTSYDNTLIVTKNSYARLCSVGAYRQEIRSPEQQIRSFNEYQAEMKAFTIFLKQKFFN